jgi:hypothetical protein
MVKVPRGKRRRKTRPTSYVQQRFFCSTCYPRFPANKDSLLIIQTDHTAVIVQSADTNAISPNGTAATTHHRPKPHSASITARHCHTEKTALLANEPRVNLNFTSVV